jgi:hypothetical protein
MCGAQVLPQFLFFRGAEGKVEQFTCTISKIQRLKVRQQGEGGVVHATAHFSFLRLNCEGAGLVCSTGRPSGRSSATSCRGV